MRIGLKFFNPKNMRQMVDIAKVSSGLDKHMKKRCAYCDDMDMGLGTELPIVEFIDHLTEKHLDKVDASDIKNYQRLVKRFG